MPEKRLPAIAPTTVKYSLRVWAACGALVAGAVAAAFLTSPLATVTSSFVNQPSESDIAAIAPSYLPWVSIGGCGAGGSGGGGAGGIKWVGRGVSGGLLDFQLLNNFSVGQNNQSFSFPARFSIKPTYTTTLGLSIPIVSKTGALQPQSNIDDKTEVTGGLGDISVDFAKNIGSEGQYSLSIALAMPTGQFDIKRGSDANKQYLPTSLQKGSGTFSATLGIGYTKDIEDAVLLFDCSYSHPFALSFTGENQFKDQWAYDYERVAEKDKKRFDYIFKPYGENDLGGYNPPGLSASFFYGNKKEEKYMYCAGITFGCPLGVTWIPSYLPSRYEPIPDPDFQAWSATLNYGMEFCAPKYPFFVGVTLPIHDKSNPPDALDPTQRFDETIVNKWSAPDWKDLGQAWSFSFGIKATMF